MKHATLVTAAALLTAMLLAHVARAEDQAKGTLVVAGKPIALDHVYAFAQKGFFDPKKQDVVVLLCDGAVPADAVRDRGKRSTIIEAGKLHCVQQTIDADGQVINFDVEDARFHPPETGGSTAHVFERKAADAETIAGRARTTSEQKSFHDIPYSYDVTFSATIAPLKP